jgi:cyanophycinase-like exopeptidase
MLCKFVQVAGATWRRHGSVGGSNAGATVTTTSILKAGKGNCHNNVEA